MPDVSTVLRAAITVAFGLTGLFCAWRCARDRRGARLGDRVGYAVHAMMSAAMIAMVWTPVRIAGAQMAVFAVAGGWFALRATGIPFAALRIRSGPVTGGCRGDRMRCAHHALSMAAMVWMFAAMGPGEAGAMPGMARPHPASPLIAGTAAAYCVLAAYALLTAGLAATSRRTGRHDRRDDLAHATISAGMAAAFIAIA